MLSLTFKVHWMMKHCQESEARRYSGKGRVSLAEGFESRLSKATYLSSSKVPISMQKLGILMPAS